MYWGYTYHIHDKNKGFKEGPKSYETLNEVRKVACSLIPKDSATRYIEVFSNGTDSGRIVRNKGRYLFFPARPAYDENLVYTIDPSNGRVVPNSKKIIKNREEYNKLRMFVVFNHW